MKATHTPASCQQENFGVVQAFSQQILHDLLDDQRAHEGVATYTQHKEGAAAEPPLKEEVCGFAFAWAASYSAPSWAWRHSTHHWSSTG